MWFKALKEKQNKKSRFLFISGLGSDLQKPLAIAVIGGMAVGTLVSLYFIPLFYLLLKRKHARNEQT